MNLKKIGIVATGVILIGIGGAFLFHFLVPSRPNRMPDIVGEFQRIKGNMFIIKAFEKRESPFGEMKREQIREYMHSLPQEKRQEMRNQMRQFLSDEIQISFSDDVQVLQNHRKVTASDLENGQNIALWKKQNDSNEAEIIIIQRIMNKKITQ